LGRSLILAGVVLVLLVGLFVFLRPEPRAGSPRERTFELYVEDGVDPSVFSVFEDDEVTFEVRSEDPAELHVHGYDVGLDVAPGERVAVSFGARLTGSFGIEDHRSGRELGALRVRPR
jgi:hypothetical protein